MMEPGRDDGTRPSDVPGAQSFFGRAHHESASRYGLYYAKLCLMSVSELLKKRRGEILQIAAQHGAKNVRIFGSAARGDSGPSSDIDFLVEMEERRSLLDLVGLWQDLEALLGRKVDVVEPEGLHWYVRDRVIKEAVPL